MDGLLSLPDLGSPLLCAPHSQPVFLPVVGGWLVYVLAACTSSGKSSFLPGLPPKSQLLLWLIQVESHAQQPKGSEGSHGAARGSRMGLEGTAAAIGVRLLVRPCHIRPCAVGPLTLLSLCAFRGEMGAVVPILQTWGRGR